MTAATPQKQRYSQTEVESDAVEFAVTQNQIYIYRVPKFIISSDHKLLYKMYKTDPQARILKNKLPIQEYHYEMIYKPRETKVADNLSRSLKSRNLSKKAVQTELFIDNVIANALRPSPNSIFNCHNPKGLKLLIRLRLGISHLRDHKFKRSFQDSLSPICNCGNDVETTTHYLLHSPLFSDERLILINNIRDIDNNILNLNNSRFSEVLLFGNSSFNNTKNTSILNTTIEYIASSKRFELPLFDSF